MNFSPTLIEDVIADFSKGNIKISSSVCQAKIYADPLIRKVLYNLFENAIRHGGNVTSIAVKNPIRQDIRPGDIYTAKMTLVPTLNPEVIRVIELSHQGLMLFLMDELTAAGGRKSRNRVTVLAIT